MKLRLIILIVLVPYSWALFKIHLDKGINLKFEWEIIANFMKDQYVVTLFVEQHYENYGHQVLKHSLENFQFGIFYYNNITLISEFWRSFQRIAMYTERIYGAIIIVQDLDLMDLVVKASTNNKIVLVLFDLDIHRIKQCMRSFWDKYRTYVMLTLSVQTNGSNQIIVQNPFQSKFYEYPIDKINSSTNFLQQLKQQYTEFMLNMYGQPVKVFIFDFPLVSMPIKNKTGHIIGYTGMHGTVLKMSSQIMNFTPIYVQAPNRNGSMFGLSSVSVIEEGRAEIGLNGRFMLNDPLNHTVYLNPMDKVPFKFIVPINYEEKPLEIFAYFFFDTASKINIAISLGLATLTWIIGVMLIKNNAEAATSVIPFNVVAIIHSVAIKIPRKIFNRILFVTIAFFGLLLASVYQGLVTKHLSTPFKPLQLDTLKDLLNSNLDIAVYTYAKGKIEKNTIEDSNNLLIMGDIGRKPVMQYDTVEEGMDMVAYNKTTALLMPFMTFNTYAVKYFNTTTGLDLLHSIKEPPTTMFVSYVMARNSPYIKLFNNFLRTYIEVGIMAHELVRGWYNQRLFYIRRIKNGFIPEEQKQVRPIRVSDMALVKYFMVIGVVVSIITFLLEHVVYFLVQYTSKRKPFISRMEYLKKK